MTNETQATPKGPTWKQAWILIAAGVVLTIGGCWIPVIGGGAFLIGVVLFLAGFIQLLKRLVRSITGK
jgi:hypothetical protein